MVEDRHKRKRNRDDSKQGPWNGGSYRIGTLKTDTGVKRKRERVEGKEGREGLWEESKEESEKTLFFDDGDHST